MTLGRYRGLMFEGKPPVVQSLAGAGNLATEGLRALTWSDLVARLGAARDLRRELGVSDIGGDASFDAFSAQHIALITDREDAADKRTVNPDDLGNGKPDGCTTGEHAAIRRDG